MAKNQGAVSAYDWLLNDRDFSYANELIYVHV